MVNRSERSYDSAYLLTVKQNIRMQKIALAAFICSLLFIATSCSTVMKVGYAHKPLAAEGCEVSYSISQQSEDLFIIVSIPSDRLVFIDAPTMKMRNLIEFNGKPLSTQSESAGVLVNYIVMPITELKAMAQFQIEKEQVPFFESDIQKVRITTMPLVHEKTFANDVIGHWLYRKLAKL